VFMALLITQCRSKGLSIAYVILVTALSYKRLCPSAMCYPNQRKIGNLVDDCFRANNLKVFLFITKEGYCCWLWT
jgi:hypothetical protein